ncbi:MAG: hypothetical protein KDK62_04905 [Chlamydiia bacterium]|nr:hypothetical protein [Chlamydiia bacterium]
MLKLLFYAILYLSQVDAIIFRDVFGEISQLDLPENMTYREALAMLQAEQGIFEEPLVDFFAARGSYKNGSRVSRQSTLYPRDYFKPINSSEKEDITFIVTTLGLGSLGKIAKSKTNLKKAGERVDRVHPFNFLYVIFSEEKSRASFHALKERSFVWSNFKDGIVGSLEEEYTLDNLKDEYIQDFAIKLSIDPDQISPYVKKKDWNALLKVLSDLLPRHGDPGRYAM